MQIGALVRRAALYFDQSPCLTEGERTISFAEFDRLTDKLGNHVIGLGLKPLDRVGVLMPNGIDSLIAYYALAKAGLVRVALNSRETVESHSYKLSDSGARALILNQSTAGNEARSGLACEIVIDAADFTQIYKSEDDRPCAVDRTLDAPFRLAYTGGTTGAPKAVTLTTRGELAELSAFLIDLIPDLREGDSFLHAAPIAHASGAFFLPSLVRGVRSIVMSKFDPGAFLGSLQRDRPTSTFLVPTMLAMILAEPGIADTPRVLRRIAYGASSISPKIMNQAEQIFGRVFVQCYGQAESPMVITCLQPEAHDRVGSCGRPFTFVEVAIVDDEDKAVACGEIGEIVCRGPQTMAYYWNRPEATATTFRNGWLHTGDIGRMDRDGYFYILDRKNDLIISGGFNVYPREVEDILLGCEGVIEAAVIGLPDDTWGERVHAVVAGAPGLDSKDILEAVKGHLAGYKRPRAIEVWDQLPKSGANKILRREIRDRIIAATGYRKET